MKKRLKLFTWQQLRLAIYCEYQKNNKIITEHYIMVKEG